MWLDFTSALTGPLNGREVGQNPQSSFCAKNSIYEAEAGDASVK